MPRGGYRPGAGRPKGVTTTTKDLTQRVSAAMESGIDIDLVTALAVVAEDPEAPVDVRLAATRRLAGCLLGKLALSTREEGLVLRPKPDPFG